MEPITLPEPLEARNYRKEEFFSMMKIYSVRCVRGGLLSVPFLFFMHYLFARWGENFPAILWTVPLLGPMMLLFGLPLFLVPNTVKFTDKYISGTYPRSAKIRWQSVQSWEIHQQTEFKQYYDISFTLRRFEKSVITVHESHGVEKIKSLIRKYGKI